MDTWQGLIYKFEGQTLFSQTFQQTSVMLWQKRLTHWGLVAHKCITYHIRVRKLCHHWTIWLVTSCWFIANWNIKNNLQWNFDGNSNTWIKESVLEKAVCKTSATWWHHQMEIFSALLALCAGNSPVTGEFPTQRPVTPSFDVFFDLRLNKRLSKQSWGWWFETLSRPFWRHCNGFQASIY